MKKSRVTQIVAYVAIVALVAVLGRAFIDHALPGRRMQRIARTMVGTPEAEVLKLLGTLRHVVLNSDLKGRTVDFPWKGMNFVPIPNRPIRNKVLLYSKMSWAVYMYIDD